MRRARVYVPNKSGHDFTQAGKFGDLIYITEGPINKFALGTFYKACMSAMSGAEAQDYLLITSLNSICCIAAGMLSSRFSKLNILLYRRDKYVLREIDFMLSEVSDGYKSA